MAIYLEANYSKKLGLPGYSSHQYSLTVKTELTDPAQVAAQSSRLYNLLQSCVDREIQTIGFLPGINGNGNGHSAAATCQVAGEHKCKATGNGADAWACSQKQKALILKIVAENSLDKYQVEALAQDKFGKSVRALNNLQASGLIEELHARVRQ